MLRAFNTAIVLEVKSLEKPGTGASDAEVVRVCGNFKGLRWSHTYAEVMQNIQSGCFAYYIRREKSCLTLQVKKTDDSGPYLTIQCSADDIQSFFC